MEDDGIVAWAMEEMLQAAGAVVVGIAHNLADGLAKARQLEFDLAVLDFELDPRTNSIPIAEVLQERGIPFLFATGRPSDVAAHEFPEVPVLGKPVRLEALRQVLANYRPPNPR